MKYFASGVFAGAALLPLICLLAAMTPAAGAGTAEAQTSAPPSAAPGTAPGADAQPPLKPGRGPLCVSLNTITRGEILNGHEMRFELRDGTKLLATLARHCPQLKFHRRFTYKAVAGRLCAGEGLILARSGEACRIAAFSTIAAPPAPPPDQPGTGSPKEQ